jgi:hypothetical protein
VVDGIGEMGCKNRWWMELVLDHVQRQASTLTVLNLQILQPDISLIRKMNTMEMHCVDGKWMVLPQESVQ